MEFKTKKLIAIIGIVFFFLLICAASIYAYSNPNETYFAAAFTTFAISFMILYYFGKGKVEKRQKHLGIQLLIMAIVPAIWIIVTIYRWYVGLPSFTSVTTGEAAFIVVWVQALVWFIAGIMIVIGSYHTDEIVEKLKK
ncbi:hypothetical protein [Methanimicrococcus blatticola]|uniref:Uncharacterized protein n=1 Tax=Methanimicrococcus blatticola TaxID=91560 RepID=A0A484F4W4_9EURY|nr:hypothetical protein [Methanimicrococcus blatticola]MBZ3935385.1 hypothetical protein [Methanimicrococcus blatticola]MCC2508517.1 hypothetical protein [Methanimicrococcus blatticola]TDQ67827.1 hypothetical protein C7391_1380 [Methanimicrococcus blatticola]